MYSLIKCSTYTLKDSTRIVKDSTFNQKVYEMLIIPL